MYKMYSNMSMVRMTIIFVLNMILCYIQAGFYIFEGIVFLKILVSN